MNVQQEFWRRLKQEWLPAYCNDPARNYDVAGFRTEAKQISYVDARDFMRALDHNVVTVDSGGRFRMPRSPVERLVSLHCRVIPGKHQLDATRRCF